MVTNLKNIKNQIDERLASGGLQELACCQLQNAQTILDNSVVVSVPNLASLPSAGLNEGRFVYVEDIQEYRFSDEASWIDNFSTVSTLFQRQLWAWGNNNSFQLGDGTLTDKCSPVREICSATDWCLVSAGGYHNAAIKTSGQLWAWGSNVDGRLGDGTITNRCSPVREFCSATDWCQASAGRCHTAAIKTSGELWAWGPGTCGRLGDGTLTARCSPVRERCSATDWCSVSAGGTHTAAVKTSGQLWAWGSNACGRLGDGTTTTRCSPVREICSATDWCSVIAGRQHTAAVKTSGQLWAWGLGTCGQLGDGTITNSCSPVREICFATDWCQVSAGDTHTAAVKTSGQIWSWGSNSMGQLSNGIAASSCSPIREICSATDWCSVSAGALHTAAIKTSGQVWVWGSNSCGSLGNGTTISRCSPVREFCSATDWCSVSAGASHTTALKIISKGFFE